MTWCELCDMDRSYCEHSMIDNRERAERAATLRVSPRGVAHFDGCPHKGEDLDYERWGELVVPGAWQRLGNGERFEIEANDGRRLTASTRCLDCVEYGPWQ